MASPAQRVISTTKDLLRPLARRIGLAAPSPDWWSRARRPDSTAHRSGRHACNICHWNGPEFIGPFHTEMAACPRCGSIARDRFLMHCFTERTPMHDRLRVLETSPRMGDGYRRMMRRFFDYTASDYDLSAHEGDIQIDLQAIALPDASIDILLTPHVLEHVPDTDRALAEIHRVLRPGGRMYLQVPLLHGTTAVPTSPEFHADNTPVFFNFGWDLVGPLRRAGFTTLALVTAEWQSMIAGALDAPPSTGDGFDVASLVSGAREHLDITRDLVSVIDLERSQRYGFSPPYHFMTWECIK